MPLVITPEKVAAIKADLPELPDVKKARLVADYGVSEIDATILTEERETARFYEIASHGRDGKLVANWLISELFGLLNKAGRSLADSPVSPENLGTVTGKVAYQHDGSPWAGGTVRVVDPEGRLQEEATTDAEGRYQVRVVPGVYNLAAGSQLVEVEVDRAGRSRRSTWWSLRPGPGCASG